MLRVLFVSTPGIAIAGVSTRTCLRRGAYVNCRPVDEDRLRDIRDNDYMSRIQLPRPEDARLHPMPNGGDVSKSVGVLMGIEAASLAVMSFLHLHGDLRGGSTPFQPSAAGIAEAISDGQALLLRRRDHGTINASTPQTSP
ncbi:MAG: hypothetical protein ACRDSP_23270 [Pseudonocardiaceae bacterium]